MRETELRKAMSLDYLKPKEEPEFKKIPTAKNVADLRDALFSVLKDSPNNPPPAPISAPRPAPIAPKQPEVKKDAIKEVPEAVLRALLETDDA